MDQEQINNIIEKNIKHYVDNYFPNQTEIDLLIQHGMVVPEKIKVQYQTGNVLNEISQITQNANKE